MTERVSFNHNEGVGFDEDEDAVCIYKRAGIADASAARKGDSHGGVRTFEEFPTLELL